MCPYPNAFERAGVFLNMFWIDHHGSTPIIQFRNRIVFPTRDVGNLGKRLAERPHPERHREGIEERSVEKCSDESVHLLSNRDAVSNGTAWIGGTVKSGSLLSGEPL
jgi:hypothetical protein